MYAVILFALCLDFFFFFLFVRKQGQHLKEPHQPCSWNSGQLFALPGGAPEMVHRPATRTKAQSFRAQRPYI